MDPSSASISERGANTFEIRGGPHLFERTPRLLFTAAIQIRPDNFQHLRFDASQLNQPAGWNGRAGGRELAIAAFEFGEIVRVEFGLLIGDFLVKVGPELRAGVQQPTAREAKDEGRREVQIACVQILKT